MGVHLSEPVFHAGGRKISYHVARYPSRRCNIPHDLTVAAIHGEGNTDLLPVPAEDLEHVRAPAHIACQDDDVACMGTDGTPLIFLEQKMISPHDPVYTLVVDPFLSSFPVGWIPYFRATDNMLLPDCSAFPTIACFFRCQPVAASLD